jgi:predicted amidophosphoribosyltransferase
MKENEKASVDLEGGGLTWWYVCEECRTEVHTEDKICPGCKRELRWDGERCKT